MHRISSIVIKNFRACKDVSLPLESYTPLVGQNNAGKSTILEAIQWVLKPAALSAGDFTVAGTPIVVAACIDGISHEVLSRIPEQKHRTAIEPYCRNGRLWIRVSASAAGAKAISKEVWDIAQCPGDDLPDHWREYPTGLPQAVSVLLPEPIVIEAMEDLQEDLGKVKAGTTIKSLLDEIMGPMLKAHADLTNALDSIKSILTTDGANRSAHLQTFDAAATDALAHFFPGLQLDLALQVVELKEIFKAGDLHVTDVATGDRRRFHQMGTGAQRAIQMALVRYLAESANSDGLRPSRRLLLVDEPELYLHPQGVRRLRVALAHLAESGFQVVFATHSPLMLSRENAQNAIRVRNQPGGGADIKRPMKQAVSEALDNAESQSRTLFQLGNIAEIYFSDVVVLCEGKTDLRLLPLAYEMIYGHPPELDHITFVSLGSCADIPKALPVLRAMGIKTRAVADLDFGYTNARSGGLLDKDGKDLTDIKAILCALQPVHEFTLNGNGLPQTEKNGGWAASDVWSVVAQDGSGSAVALRTHEELKIKDVWIWPVGCIEQVTGCADKGEDAILEQEEQLRGMSAVDIDSTMPRFRGCFEWILA
ncbi:MAG: ATP-dependent nuclease [Burkholderiaceae bacterium]